MLWSLKLPRKLQEPNKTQNERDMPSNRGKEQYEMLTQVMGMEKNLIEPVQRQRIEPNKKQQILLDCLREQLSDLDSGINLICETCL